ncbi:MAG: adenylyltransferase/cytidyltransferase family protein [Armatimonadetes bacterium]|nr:adenylyltransferase/cytidyltransferase family protein [Armatimonadota bacterium]
MTTFSWPQSERPAPRPRVVAVGAFDGVHVGHRHLLSRLCQEAKARGATSCAVTFEPTPAQVFSDGPPHSLRLSPADERLDLLSKLCIDEVCVLDFSQPEVRAMRARDFLAIVVRGFLNAVAICGAESHELGSDRVPWPSVAELARSLGLEPLSIDLRRADGKVITSSDIRELVWAGDVEAAAALLGRDYIVSGRVTRGAGVGRKLGFPTANLQVSPDKLLPADGVYAGWAVGDPLGPGPLASSTEAWPAAINVGTCPTFARGTRSVEVHIIGWAGEISGHSITVGFIRRLRGEYRFPREDLLRDQIARDVEAAARIAQEHFAVCARS